MRGSGLSLERFIKGKAHKTKGEAKAKKRVIVHKAQRRREYEKVKKREAAAGEEESTSGGGSFYDRFFRDLQSGKGDASDDGEGDMKPKAKKQAKEQATNTEKEPREHVAKPDPFFKAKKKAEVAKQEKQRAREERQRKQAELEKKVNQRKKRHVKLSVRTASGQPVVRNHISDILAKLQAEKGGK